MAWETFFGPYRVLYFWIMTFSENIRPSLFPFVAIRSSVSAFYPNPHFQRWPPTVMNTILLLMLERAVYALQSLIEVEELILLLQKKYVFGNHQAICMNNHLKIFGAVYVLQSGYSMLYACCKLCWFLPASYPPATAMIVHDPGANN